MVVIFFRDLMKKKNQGTNLVLNLTTSKNLIFITYGCLNFIDLMRFLHGSLEDLSKNIKPSDFNITHRELGSLGFHAKKVTYLCDYFKSIFD